MRGSPQDLLRAALLHDPAVLHHDDAVADGRDHAEVVRDEDHRQPFVPPQGSEQVEDPGLDRHVEGRGGLVRDQDPRTTGQRSGDHDPLLHPS
jgi:hypothetical protein